MNDNNILFKGGELGRWFKQGPSFCPPELVASGEISEHNSMGFLGVKKRHPYLLGQRILELKQ